MTTYRIKEENKSKVWFTTQDSNEAINKAHEFSNKYNRTYVIIKSELFSVVKVETKVPEKDTHIKTFMGTNGILYNAEQIKHATTKYGVTAAASVLGVARSTLSRWRKQIAA